MESIIQHWINALKGEKYRQGTGKMHRNNMFCCLGVLCEISGIAAWEEGNHLGNDSWNAMKYLGRINDLPSQVVELAGMTTSSGDFKISEAWLNDLSEEHRMILKRYIAEITGGETIRPIRRLRASDSLAAMNDAGHSFKVIAALIESRPEGLFKEE